MTVMPHRGHTHLTLCFTVRSFFAALSALPPAGRSSIGVLRGVFMPVWAVRFAGVVMPASFHDIFHVV